MPKIPDVQVAENAPGPVAFQRATGESFGGSEAAALNRLGGTVEQLYAQASDAYQDAKSSSVIAKSQRRMNDYMQELKEGPVDPSTGAPLLDEGGNVVAPVDPSLHSGLYQKKIEEIRQDGENELGGQAKGLQRFHDSFDTLANRQLLAVQTDAIGLMHHQHQVTLENSLQTLSEEYVKSPEISKARIQAEAAKSIKDAVDARMITPQEGFEYQKRFAHQAEWGSARKIMQSGKDGPMQLVNAIDKGDFSTLPIDQQEKLRNMALTKRDSDDRHALAAVEHKIKFDEYTRKLDGDKAFKNLYDNLLDHDPAMPQKLADAKPTLSPTQYEVLKRGMTKDDVPSDKGYVNILRTRIRKGENMQDILEDAAGIPQPTDPPGMIRKPRINAEDYAKLMEEEEKYAPLAKENNPGKNGIDNIHKYFGGDSPGKSAFEHAAEANAQEAFRDFLRENPKATPKEINEAVETVKRNGKIFGLNEMPLALQVPKYVTVSKLDLLKEDGSGQDVIDAAAKKLWKAYQAKEIGEAEYKRNASLIQQWSRQMPSKPVPAAQGASK